MTITQDFSGSRKLPTNGITSTLSPTGMGKDILEPIAVIGMSLKFPQEATSQDSFWNILMEKQCTTMKVPTDRFNIGGFYSADPKYTSTISAEKCHFLKDNFRAFDSSFFSISPADALAMDAQQRGLLETTYHALENAGLPLDQLKGTKTSVHVGSLGGDHRLISWRDPDQIPKYSATGIASSVLAGRISWFFDLKGPCMTVDTACSSSLVALSLSCNNLWAGESEIAITAGANIIESPELSIAFSNLTMMSPDGICYSFDERANGYARGEGFGVLILKRLSTAVRDGDTIRALIRSTGVNQDGFTSGGVSQPSKDSQATLIKETYIKAGLESQLTGYFEAHGTGTPVGDPIEARAIGESFIGRRHNETPLYIGALKSNIGHLEGSSGIAGLIKAVLVLEKGIIPPNANFENVNPLIDAEFFNLKFPIEPTLWPNEGLRRASINSFGIGGTNAHAVLDDAGHYLASRGITANHVTTRSPKLGVQKPKINQVLSASEPRNGQHEIIPQLMIFSAKDGNALGRMSKSYSQFFSTLEEEADAAFLRDLAHTLNARRTTFPWRSFVVANSISGLITLEKNISKPVKVSSSSKLGFFFTGQGAQWATMGVGLRVYREFEESLLMSQTYLQKLGCKWLLIDELEKDSKTSRINEAEYSQPLSTALQLALVDLLRSLSIFPSTVVGHSSGEIAAAYSTGSISAESAMKLAYYRGILASRLSKTTSLQYSMASIGLSEADARDLFAKIAQVGESFDAKSMTISCLNSFNNTTISGPEVQIDSVIQSCTEMGIFARKLLVDLGYHSPQMQKIASEYQDKIQGLEPGVVSINAATMVSSLTGTVVSADTLRTSEYWVRNMVSTVDFISALSKCCQRHTSTTSNKLNNGDVKDTFVDFWLEVGPHSSFQGPIREIWSSFNEGPVGYSSVVARKHSAIETLLTAAGRLFCNGFTVDLTKLNSLPSKAPRKCLTLTNLPEYPFDHSTQLYHETRISKRYRLRKPANRLLGAQVLDWTPFDPRWRLLIRLEEMPWLEDHKVNGVILCPAAGMLTMAIEAAKEMAGDRRVTGYEIRNANFHTQLVIPTDVKSKEVQISLRPSTGIQDENAWFEFSVFVNKADDEWEETCRGSISVEFASTAKEVDGGKESQQRLSDLRDFQSMVANTCTHELETDKFYRLLKSSGLDFGPTFKIVDKIRWSDDGKAIAKSVAGGDFALRNSFNHVIHPTVLDSFFQLAFVAFGKEEGGESRTILPTGIERLRISYADVAAADHGPFKVVSHYQGEEVASQLPDGKNHLCLKLEWKAALETMDAQNIIEYCRDGYVQREDPLSWARELQTYEFIILAFATQALEKLKRYGRTPLSSMAKYIAWIQEKIAADLARLPPADRKRREAELADSSYLERVCDEMEGERWKLLTGLGRDLYRILVGEVDPLMILFEGEQLAKKFYEEANDRGQVFDLFASYLDALLHKNPSMNIFEIGAGTGSATKSLHKTMTPEGGATRYENYSFTDIGRAFLEDAKESFKDYDQMSFQVLDIEKDPLEQGFKAESFDLIIASHVLHATTNLEKTLQNVRKLLKPGGKLVFMESTVPQSLRVGFIFGLLPGWWLSSEKYRSLGPLVTESQWNGLLESNGFSGTDLVIQDYDNGEAHDWSLMVSTSIGSSSPLPKPVVIREKTSGFQQKLAEQLNSQLELLGSSLLDTVTLEGASKMKNLQNTHFIFLSELENPVLRYIEPAQFSALQLLLTSARSFLWVTKGGGESPQSPDYAMCQGMCRVVSQENPSTALVSVALDTAAGANYPNQARNIAIVFQNTVSSIGESPVEPEYRERNGILQICRAVDDVATDEYVQSRTERATRPAEFGAGPPLKVHVEVPGMLNSLVFVEDCLIENPLGPEEVQVEVKAIGINFKDLLSILGRINEQGLGFECAGIVHQVGENVKNFRPGDRVAVCAGEGFSYRKYMRVPFEEVIEIPSNISFTEAASLPICFLTAYYCIHEAGNLKKGDTILIHAAAGGTGQAAIQFAQHAGAEVFATVGFEWKKKLLMEQYNVPEDHIFYSRDATFAAGIKRMTNGRGVDMVLNSLAGNLLVASWECVAPFGRFFELGKRDILSRASLPMGPFINNLTFTGVDLGAITELYPKRVHNWLRKVFSLMETKIIRPAYPLHVHPLSGIEQAFRALQTGQSSGKHVLEIASDDVVPTSLKIKSNFQLDPNASYLVAGGLGGLGMVIARWLVDRGAMHILLISRSGVETNKEAQSLLSEIQERGVRIEAPRCDVADHSALESIIRKYDAVMPPIKGCFQCAMVLRDSVFAEMSFDSWQSVINPKVQGSWNLHDLLPSGMDFFVLLSSITGVVGNPGQSNYGAGNTYQDALAHYRRACGEKATALDLPGVLDAGYVAQNPEILQHLLSLHLLRSVSLEELHALFDFSCDPKALNDDPKNTQVVVGVELPARTRSQGFEVSPLLSSPLFLNLHQIESSGQGRDVAASQTIDFEALFASSTSADEVVIFVSDAILKKLSTMLNVAESEIEVNTAIEMYGVDSLVSVELRNWLAKVMKANIPVFDLRGAATITSIATTVTGKSSFREKVKWA